jgi:hypothetical protein
MTVSGVTLLRQLRESDPESCVTLVSGTGIVLLTGSHADNIVSSSIGGGSGGDGLAVGVNQGETALFTCSMPSTQDFSDGSLLLFLVGGQDDALSRIYGLNFYAYSAGDRSQYRKWIIFDDTQTSTWQSFLTDNALYFSQYIAVTVQISGTDHPVETTGSFDASNIVSVGFEYERQSADLTKFTVNGLLRIRRLTLTGGTSGTPLTMEDFSAYVNGWFKDAQQRYLSKLGTTAYTVPFNLKLGDGSTETHFFSEFQSLIFEAPSGTSDAARLRQYDKNIIGLVVDTSSSDSIAVNRSSIISTADYELTLGGDELIYTGGTIRGFGTASISGNSFQRTAFVEGLPIDADGGTFSNCAFADGAGSYLINWSNSADFSGSNFDGDSDYYIRIGSDNVANDATVDVADLTFGTPGTTEFLIDAATGITITTAAGATLTKTEINSGSATFQTPVVAYDFGVSGAPTGSSIAIFQSTGSNSLIAKRNEFTLASGNNSGNSILVVNETIPDDKPDSGFVRVLRDDGTEDRLPYSSWSGSTFTLDSATLPTTYSSGNGAYVGYVDVLGSSTGSESNELQYVANRNCVLTVRLGSGANRIRDIRQALVKQAQDQVIPITGFFDSINITT